MSKKIIKKSSIIFAIGFIMIVGSVVVISSKNTKTEAAATNYTITWNATQWRTLKHKMMDPSYAVGPSEWKVTGNVGGKTISETWTAGGWKDAILHPSSSDYQFINLANFTYTYLAYGSVDMKCRVSGLYAVSCIDTPEWSPTLLYSAISFPSTWTITGTIN